MLMHEDIENATAGPNFFVTAPAKPPAAVNLPGKLDTKTGGGRGTNNLFDSLHGYSEAARLQHSRLPAENIPTMNEACMNAPSCPSAAVRSPSGITSAIAALTAV